MRLLHAIACGLVTMAIGALLAGAIIGAFAWWGPTAGCIVTGCIVLACLTANAYVGLGR